MDISGVVLTKDGRISPSLRNSLSLCDEIVVLKCGEIDDYSHWRNLGLKKAKGDWVLFADSDEIVSDSLAREILSDIKNSSFNGYYIRRRDILWGEEVKTLGINKAGLVDIAGGSFLRLGRKGKGTWKRKVHETWEIKGKVGKLKEKLIHYPHPTIREFINHADSMSSLHALENAKEGKKSDIIKIIVWPSGKFILDWIFATLSLGLTKALVFALMMSFHSFLAWSKQWLSQRN